MDSVLGTIKTGVASFPFQYIDYDFLNVDPTNTVICVYYRYERYLNKQLTDFNVSVKEKELSFYKANLSATSNWRLCWAETNSSNDWELVDRYRVCLRGRITFLVQGGERYVLTGDNKLMHCGRLGAYHIGDIVPAITNGTSLHSGNEQFCILDRDNDELLFTSPVHWRLRWFSNEHIRT